MRVEPLAARGARDRARPRRATLVVGGGMAGLAMVEQLLAHGAPGASLTIVGRRAGAALRPHPAVARARGRGGAGRAGAARAPRWFAERGVELRSGVAARALDLDGGVAELVGRRRRVEFDRFVLATGSQPALPPIAGLERRGVHAFRSLRDVARDPAAAARRRAARS